jgi:hypothetical protein
MDEFHPSLLNSLFVNEVLLNFALGYQDLTKLLDDNLFRSY